MEYLHFEHVYVVGHDIGGMVAYAFARRYPESSRGVMLLDAPVPGLGPWDAVKANPITWHINFQQTPVLPEQLIAGREAIYFRHFLDSDTFSDADVARYARAYAAPNICARCWKYTGLFPRTRNSMQLSATRSVCLSCWLPEITRFSRNSHRGLPKRYGIMAVQTSRLKSSRIACIT